MSWSLLLRKSWADGKPWTDELPAEDISMWKFIFDNLDSFITDIKNDNYSTQKINKTIEILKTWSVPKNYRKMEGLKSPKEGVDKLQHHKEMLSKVERLYKEVLPKLIDRRADIKIGQSGLNLKPKQTQVGDKNYDWSNPEDIKRYFNDNNYKDSKRKKQILKFVNDNLSKHKGVKSNPELKQWAFNQKINTHIREINERAFNQKPPQDAIFTSKSPIVKLFGIKIQTRIGSAYGRGGNKKTDEEKMRLAVSKFKDYKVKEHFTSREAGIYYEVILKRNDKFMPLKFKNIRNTGLRPQHVNKEVKRFLLPRYDNMNDNLYSALIKDAIKENVKDIGRARFMVIRDLADFGGRERMIEGKLQSFQVPRETESIKLSESEKEGMPPTTAPLKERQRYIETLLDKIPPQGVTDNLYTRFQNWIAKNQNKINLSISEAEKELIDALKDEDYLDKLYDFTQSRRNIRYGKLEDLSEFIEPNAEKEKDISKITYTKQDGLYYLEMRKYKPLLNDFKEEVRLNKSRLSSFPKVVKILEEEITSPIKTSSDKKTYTLEGFDKNEKELAELIYNGLESKMDFESVLNESEDSDTFNLAELLNTFKNVGATFGTNFNRSILEFEYEDDLNYKELLYGEKPFMFEEIKQLMSDLKEDTPKLRNFLIEAAKEMVEEILKNPIYYIEDELKKKFAKLNKPKFKGEKKERTGKDTKGQEKTGEEYRGEWESRLSRKIRKVVDETTLDILSKRKLIEKGA